MSRPTVHLLDIASFNPPPPRKLTTDEEIAFVPMASASENGSMRVGEYRPASSLSNGYSYFQNGDVLVAKITPCFENNKIVLAEIDRTHGFGSTEFHVIRPDARRLDSRFLTFFLRQDSIRSEGERRMTGSAGQRRVPRQFFEQLEIPLLPLDEQRRIVAILDKADELRRKRRETLTLLDPLEMAIFSSIFGNRGKAENWSTDELGNLCNLVRGSSPRPQGDSRYFGGSVPRLMIADITRDGMRVWPSIDSLTEEGARRSRPMKAGSVVMAVSGAVGLPAILQIDACIHDGFVGFRDLSSRLVPEFLYFWLVTERRRNADMGTGAIWVNLNTDQVRRLKVPIPPIALQRKFVSQTAKIDKLQAAHRAHLDRLNALFLSLQHRAFGGGL